MYNSEKRLFCVHKKEQFSLNYETIIICDVKSNKTHLSYLKRDNRDSSITSNIFEPISKYTTVTLTF